MKFEMWNWDAIVSYLSRLLQASRGGKSEYGAMVEWSLAGENQETSAASSTLHMKSPRIEPRLLLWEANV